MAQEVRTQRDILIDRIFLDHENPRHEPYETQGEIISYLCSDEEVPQLARDIAKHGLSPFDRFGVVQDSDSNAKDPVYTAAEGNRRLCALKLLTDPDLAPRHLKEFFEKEAERWTPITSVPCVIFHNEEDLNLWLDRRHQGPAGGVGQKPWNSDQKARHSGAASRNRVALAFLDYAEAEELIKPEERKRRLTTVQRFLSNPVMRETMGIDTSKPNSMHANRQKDDFHKMASRFIGDMLANDPKVNSRRNKAEIENYARELNNLPGLGHTRVDSYPLTPSKQSSSPNSKRKTKPKALSSPKSLPHRTSIEAKLKTLNIRKLQSLYHSICDLNLRDHTPLLAVGLWSFVESLTARCGRNPTTDFVAFLSTQRLTDLGLGDKNATKALREAINQIQKYGNSTKHHDKAAAFNPDQLYNDMEIVSDLLERLIDEAIAEQRK